MAITRTIDSYSEVPVRYAGGQIIPGDTAETQAWGPTEVRRGVGPNVKQSAIILSSVIAQRPGATIKVAHDLKEHIQDSERDDECIRRIVRRLASVSQKIQGSLIGAKSDVGRVASNPHNGPSIRCPVEREFVEETARYDRCLKSIDKVRGLDCPCS